MGWLLRLITSKKSLALRYSRPFRSRNSRRRLFAGYFVLIASVCLFSSLSFGQEFPNEVINIQSPAVVVRVHPKTGRPYVAITEPEARMQNPLGGFSKPVKRPDYRMLEKDVKPKETGYEGPSSDRKKVYIFAASIAASGVASGTAILAAPAAAAAGTGSGTGAAVFAGAGTAVAAGTTVVTADALRIKPQDGNYTRESVSQELRDFLKN